MKEFTVHTDKQIDTTLEALERELALRVAVESAHARFQVRPSRAAAAALEAALTDWRQNDKS